MQEKEGCEGKCWRYRVSIDPHASQSLVRRHVTLHLPSHSTPSHKSQAEARVIGQFAGKVGGQVVPTALAYEEPWSCAVFASVGQGDLHTEPCKNSGTLECQLLPFSRLQPQIIFTFSCCTPECCSVSASCGCKAWSCGSRPGGCILCSGTTIRCPD